MQLPVVDYRHPRRPPRRFCQSLHETGFGVLANHPLDQKLVEGIYREWLDFFDTDVKFQYLAQTGGLTATFRPPSRRPPRTMPSVT